MSFIQDALEAEYHKARAYRLYAVNRRSQTPYKVALAAVYGVPRFADLDSVRARLDAIRELLLDRTFDMARFEKRFPVSGIIADEHYCDQDRLLNAFRLCCWCRPPGVIYPPKTQKKRIKSCGHYNFCPACWARVVVQQYAQYEDLISISAAASPLAQFYATTHIVEEFIPFPAITDDQHADDETYNTAVTTMSRTIQRYKGHLTRRWKHINRNTVASLWRIVPIAASSGWRIQLRRLLLTKPGVIIPSDTIRHAPTVFKTTVRVSREVNDDAAIAFIAFSAYPEEHLKHDLDLTAAGLSAMTRQHMLGGTGKFRKAGDSLIAAARKRTKDKAVTHHGAQKTAG